MQERARGWDASSETCSKVNERCNLACQASCSCMSTFGRSDCTLRRAGMDGATTFACNCCTISQAIIHQNADAFGCLHACINNILPFLCRADGWWPSGLTCIALKEQQTHHKHPASRPLPTSLPLYLPLPFGALEGRASAASSARSGASSACAAAASAAFSASMRTATACATASSSVSGFISRRRCRSASSCTLLSQICCSC